MTHLCSLYSACGASPGHYDGVFCDFTLEDLVPADDLLAELLQEVCHSCHNIALEVVLCIVIVVTLDAELLDLGLTVRTFLPLYLRTLVSTDVYVLGREEFRHFCKDVLKENHSFLLTGTENLICDAPAAPHVIWTACTSEFRVSCKRCKHMARKIDFRNDGDTLRCCVCYDFAHLVLAVPAALAVRCAVIFVALEYMSDDGLLPYRSHFGEFRIFLDLDSPSLVVSEVPVEGVELVDLHNVEILLHFLDCPEVA